MFLCEIILICFMLFGQSTSSGDAALGPLLLTPLLDGGNIQEAQKASQVYIKDFPDIISYSGFFNVNKHFNSNLFFWFFPAQNGNKSAPVLVFLEGGPGTSSLYGMFLEHGPFSVEKDLRLKPRKFSWTSSYSVVYVDNPVGTGFSFTDPGGYSTDETQVGTNLYNFLLQFFTLFPELQANDLFVTGESYAGKYVPAVCHEIHKENPSAKLKINLKGLAIGNGLIDPVSLLTYGDFLYQSGLVDVTGRDIFKQKEHDIAQYIQQKQWKKASDAYAVLIEGYGVNSTIFSNLTGFSLYFNVLRAENYLVRPFYYVRSYLSTEAVQEMLHVGRTNASSIITSDDVRNHLIDEIMQSVKPWFEILVEHYRVLIYNGQLDIIVPYSSTVEFLDNLSWSGTKAYKAAPRNLWNVGGALAGYSKRAKNLTFVLVRNASHMVPYDQPEWALDMISKFINNVPF